MKRAELNHMPTQAFEFAPAGRLMEVLHTPFELLGQHVIRPIYETVAPAATDLLRAVNFIPNRRERPAQIRSKDREEISRVSGEARNPGPPKEGKPHKSLRQRLVATVPRALRAAKHAKQQQSSRPAQLAAIPSVKPRSNPNTRTVRAEVYPIHAEELVGPVIPTAAGFQVLYSLPINPGNSALAYGGVAYADLYEEFEVKKITFEYMHSASTAVAGDVYMMIDTDPRDGPPTSAQQLCQNKLKKPFAPYDDARLTASARDWTTKRCFVRESTALQSNAEDRQNYPGVFYLCTDHVTAAALNTSLGRLFVNYHMVLRKRRPPQAISFLSDSTSASFTFTAANQYVSLQLSVPTTTQRGFPFSEQYSSSTPVGLGSLFTNVPGGNKCVVVEPGTVHYRVSINVLSNTTVAATQVAIVTTNTATGATNTAGIYSLAAGVTGFILYAADLVVPASHNALCLCFQGLTNVAGSISLSTVKLGLQVHDTDVAPELVSVGVPTAYGLPQNRDALEAAIAGAPSGTVVTVTPPGVAAAKRGQLDQAVRDYIDNMLRGALPPPANTTSQPGSEEFVLVKKR